MKPNERIEAELKGIASLRSKPWIELADDNTFAQDRQPGPWLELLGRINAKWFTESDWLIGERPELLRRIAAAGCRQILIGLESPIHVYPGMGSKTASHDRMMRSISNIQRAGIVVNACFIVGADGETPQSIDRLAEFLEFAPFGEIQVTLQTPFPGTKLFEQMQRDNRLLFDDFSRYTLFDVTFEPDAMSVEDLRTAFRNLITRVYGRDASLRRAKRVHAIRRRRRDLA